jgi:hypothetical protein
MLTPPEKSQSARWEQSNPAPTEINFPTPMNSSERGGIALDVLCGDVMPIECSTLRIAQKH